MANIMITTIKIINYSDLFYSHSDYEASNYCCSHYRRNEQPLLFNLFLNRYLLFQRSDPNVRLVSRLTDLLVLSFVVNNSVNYLLYFYDANVCIIF